jgi:lantibiotic biosynthesis protein
VRMPEKAVSGMEPSGFFVLRTPLLPLNVLVDWGADLEAPRTADHSQLAGALERDRKRLGDRLYRIASRPDFSEALFVASPSLAAALDPARDERGEISRKAEASLVAYVSRAAARATPFGLFAGCTVGSIEQETRLHLPAQQAYERHSTLDAEYVSSLAAAAARDEQLRRELTFHANSTLYEVGGRLFLAATEDGSTGRSYRLVAVDKTPYLAATLERARAGASGADLAKTLVDGDVTRSDADAYIDELIESELLIPETSLQVTGDEPAASLAMTLERYSAGAGIARRLHEVRSALAAMDVQGVGVPASRYRDVSQSLSDLPASPEISRLFQVNLMKPGDDRVALGADVVDTILQGVDALHRLSRVVPHRGLARFREEFVRRYETREVPLAEALDEENGIGFERSDKAGAELAKLISALEPSTMGDGEGRWTRRDAVLVEMLLRAESAKCDEIVLQPHELEAITPDELVPLPDAFEVLATLAAASDSEVQAGRFRVVIHSASGPSGARLLGRFCHASRVLRAQVADHLQKEEATRPDCVFAEIVHLPEGRVGNLLSRPVLRSFEIPYLGRSGAPADHQLPISDLLVSVDRDRIVVRSRRLEREVIPRMTTAHNHGGRGLGVYRFLCALQHQGVAPGTTWDWGPFAGLPFLPRVVFGRAVLSRARWNLDDAALDAFRKPDDEAVFAAVRRLRRERGIPRYVALADGDNELVTDLDNILSVRALGRQLRRRSIGTLVELLPGPDELCATGPEGGFTHELVVPFNRVVETPPAGSGRRGRTPRRAIRRFAPGSDWLYLKLYSGQATADHVLDRAVDALARIEAAEERLPWFFIRYLDPDPHIRLRVRLGGSTLPQRMFELVRTATDELVRSGHVWRLQLDTYEREVERYGGSRGIVLAERIFHADSEAVLSILRHAHGAGGAAIRWRAALLGIDRLYADFGFDAEERRAVARRARAAYGTEFGAGRAFRRATSDHYRAHRASIEALLDRDAEHTGATADLVAAMDARSEGIIPLAEKVRRLDEKGELAVSALDMVMSLAHMHVNRMLRSAQRAQELALYELLEHRYSSQTARAAR